MAKIYDIKTKKEVIEVSVLSAKQLMDILWNAEEALRMEGFEESADHVRSARARLMPTYIRERKQNRKQINEG